MGESRDGPRLFDQLWPRLAVETEDKDAEPVFAVEDHQVRQ